MWSQPKCPSVDEWIKKVRLHNWIQLTHKNLKPSHCDNGHYVKWNKSGTGPQTRQDLTHEKSLKPDFLEVESRIGKAVCGQNIKVGNQGDDLPFTQFSSKEIQNRLKI
jgi:hypothetical protein